LGLSVAGSFVCRCLTSSTMLRFHFPLIEPDVRISRIRLSEKAHAFAHGRLAVRFGKQTKPSSLYSEDSGNRWVPGHCILCLAHNH